MTVPLTEVDVGNTVTVVDLRGGKGLNERLQALGIRCGTQITKISDSFAHGPIVLRHGDARTALGRGICHKILVETSLPETA